MFRFVKNKGNVLVPPVFVNVYGSGTIQRGSVVRFRETGAANLVTPAASGTTYTSIFGIALDYIQGASDSQTRVIPFVQGQLWEADCANGMTTAMLFIRHALTDNLTVNNTTSDVDTPTGVFIAYAIPNYVSAGVSNTFRVIGEFIRNNNSVGQNQSTFI